MPGLKLKSSDEEDKKASKYRKAAYKAWKTIRSKRLERAKVGVKSLTEFISPHEMGDIRHPEDLSAESGDSWQGNRIVTQFHKTPSDIACGRFWELRWAFGCPLDCSYCYLRGTMKGNMKPRYIKTEHVLEALDEAFRMIKKPSVFNAGELSDSLMNPYLMEPIVDKFEEQSKHKLALLSKFGPDHVKFLTKKPRKQTICAWSINAPAVASRWEKAATHPDLRIEAARQVYEVGYETRIRIDPMFPIKDWKIHYEDLIHRILSKLTPARIILGTPRGLWKTIKQARESGIDMAWAQFFREDSSWGKKLEFELRKEMYQFMYDKLTENGYDKQKISMCKETLSTWESLGLKCKPLTCNCYGQL